jgi:hypothetical protein
MAAVAYLLVSATVVALTATACMPLREAGAV